MTHKVSLTLLLCCFVLASVEAQQRRGRASQQRKPNRRESTNQPAATPAPTATPSPIPAPTPTPTQIVPGDLDLSFGKDGMVTTTIGTEASAHAIAIQPDGRIIVTGGAYSGSTWDFAVARYNVDGSLDTTFDGDGKATTRVGSVGATALAVAIQRDGKIVAAGYSDKEKPTSAMSALYRKSDIAIVRYNADGSIDTTFSGDGIVTTEIPSGEGASHYMNLRKASQTQSVAIQMDGRIVVTGRTYQEGLDPWDTQPSAVTVRYNTDGSLDNTFSGNGIAACCMDSPGFSSRFEGHALAIQSDGRILITGAAVTSSCEDRCVFIARFNANGTPDKSFGYYGVNNSAGGMALDTSEKLHEKPGGLHRNSEGNAIVIQSDSKIVVAASTSWEDNDIGLLRFEGNGWLDTHFGQGGLVRSDISPKAANARAVAIQSDGRIIVGGYVDDGTNSAFALVRYTANGSLDSSWGKNGIVTTNFGGQARASAIATQADGRIVAAGYKFKDFAIARYLNPLSSGGK